MRRLSLIGGSAGAAAGAASAAAAARAGPFRVNQAALPASPDSARNGSIGRPGISESTAAAPDASASGFGLPSWRTSAASVVPSMPAFVTTMPAAVDTSSAGICVTSPSPTVRTVKVLAASANPMPWRPMPIISPPRILTVVMISPAIASPRTNFAAPSMAP